MKFKKYSIIAVVVLLLLFSFYIALRGIHTPAPTQPNGPTISIPTSQGSVQVPDVTQNPVFQTIDTYDFKKSDQYEIVYFSQEKSFTITILAPPAQQSRDAAEQAFLDTLAISKADACKLSVSLTVPYDVDPTLAGKDYGLSFCPSGSQFGQ